LLTIFATPKPFRGHIDVIQRNAIASWMYLQPTPQVILMGDEEGIAAAAADYGCFHMPEISRNEYGTPLVSAVFAEAERLAQHDVLCYLNGDIILMQDAVTMVRRVMERMSRFLLIGRRWNIDITEPLIFDETWELRLRELIETQGELYPPLGSDFFVFPKGLWGALPPLVIGRVVWDNWMIYRARALKVPVVDGTTAAMIVHQNHDYSHKAGGQQEVWFGIEAQRNREIAKNVIFTFENASHILTPQGWARPPLTYNALRGQVYLLRDWYPSLRMVSAASSKLMNLAAPLFTKA
jgi:hypothetical protein